jgi:putative membrane protein
MTAKRKESVMKPLNSFGTAPIAAALLVLLAAAGCKKHENTADENATPPAASTTAPMPAEPASTMGPPPASTSASPMASDMAASNMPAESAATTGPVTDTAFYSEAMTGNQKEINSSQLVEKSGSSADVKTLAKKIEADHTAFDKKVKAAAGSNAATPSAADTTDSTLTGKTGADLDKAYVDAMVTDHQDAIPKFENAAKNASTDEAKKLANEALPKLRDHLKMAQDLQQKMASK